MRTGAKPVTLDPFDPVWRADPYPLYRHLRELGDLVRTEHGFWVAARSAAANAVLRDATRFSSRSRAVRRGRRMGSMATSLGETVQTADPPAHGPIRLLLAGPFKPRRIASFDELVQGVVDRLVAECRDAGTVDFATAVAYEVPLQVITRLLGVPEGDRHLFRPWSDAFAMAQGRRPSAEVLDRADLAMDECLGYLAELADRRAREPGDDLLSMMLAAEEEGDRLTRRQVLVNAMLMLVAGHETTANLLSNAVHALLGHPSQWAALCADPELAADAVEESLRYDPPVQLLSRIVDQDTEFLGERLAAEESIVIALGAAGRDPEVFENPDVFDIRRRPREPHLAFGAGRHYCLGAPLARMEAVLTLRAMATEFPGLRPAGAPERLTSETVRGFRSLPLHLR